MNNYVINNSVEWNLSNCVSLTQDRFMLNEKFNQDLETSSFKRKIDSCEIQSFFTF